MIKNSIRLLVTLVLVTTALGAGWTDASSSPSSAATSLRTGASGATDPPALSPFSGDPDPVSVPVPKYYSRGGHYYRATGLPWWSRAGRIWAMWYLKTAW